MPFEVFESHTVLYEVGYAGSMLTVTAAPCGPAAVPEKVWHLSHVTTESVVHPVRRKLPTTGSGRLYVVPFTTKLERMPGRVEYTLCIDELPGMNSIVFCRACRSRPFTAGWHPSQLRLRPVIAARTAVLVDEWHVPHV